MKVPTIRDKNPENPEVDAEKAEVDHKTPTPWHHHMLSWNLYFVFSVV